MEATWTIPKNIRQIGEAHAHYAIYIEDYVSTYIKQVIRLSDGGIRQGALVGKVYPDGEKTTFVIQGIVTDKEIYRTREQLFSAQGKETLREQCGKFFGEMDIIGEVMFDSGKDYMDTARRGILSENTGAHRMLLHVDCADGAQEFCIGSQGAVEIVESYYIYYERNEAMQNYLIAYNEETRRKVEDVHDIISGQARAAMGEVRMPRPRMQKDTLLICTTCALLICVSLLGIININQYQKMCKLEQSFQYVMASLGFGDGEAVSASSDDVLPGGAALNDSAGENGVLDITPENGIAAGDAQNGLFDGLPIYVADATQEGGDNGSERDADGIANGLGQTANESGENASEQSENTGLGVLERGADMGDRAEANGENTSGQGTDANGGNASGQGTDADGGNVSGQGTNADGGNTLGQGTNTAGGNASGQETNATGGNASGQGMNADGESTSDGTNNGGGVSEQGAGTGDRAGADGVGGNASEGYREYTIQRGDTLTSISMLFYQNRSMIEAICRLNGIENADNIVAGQKILLP